MNKTIVSIILPSFNSQEYIYKTIKSIQKQTFNHWELLITDDCSTDNTISIINKLIDKDKRIKLFTLNKNSGPGIARNHSISRSKGRYIAFCDSDDIWLPKKLETQINFLSKNNLLFTYSSYYVSNDDGKIIGKIISKKKLTFNMLLQNNYIACFTAIYDSDKLGKIYMSKMRKRQDWTLWLKIMKICKITYGNTEILGIYRKRKNSISSNKLSLLKYNWKIYRDELKFSYLKSILFMFLFFVRYFQKKLK